MSSQFRIRVEAAGETHRAVFLDNGSGQSLPLGAALESVPTPEGLERLTAALAMSVDQEQPTEERPLHILIDEPPPRHPGGPAGELPIPWPWEALQVPGQVPLSCRQNLGLARSALSASVVARPAPGGALRLLAVGCTPDSLPLLNVDAELAALRTALSRRENSGDIELMVREIDTRNSLLALLEEFRPHILHFIGHTIIERGERCLALRGKLGVAPLRPDELATLVVQSGVSLAVLSACASVPIARHLAQRGLPAVGMIDDVRDAYARAFAEGFYAALAQGRTLDCAVNAGRFYLYMNHRDAPRPPWSLPVLVVPNASVAAFRVSSEPVPQAELRIDCPSPGPAQVLVNGELQAGLTPLVLRLRLNYPHEITLRRLGYYDASRRVTLVKRRDSLVLSLLPRVSNLPIHVMPPVANAQVQCRSLEDPQRVYEARTDVLGRAEVQALPIGDYQVSINLSTSNACVRVDETDVPRPLLLRLPLDVSVANLVLSIGQALLGWLQQPTSMVASILAMILLTMGALYLHTASRPRSVPAGMQQFVAVTNYPVLGVNISDENTPRLDAEDEGSYRLRKQQSQLLIDELRQLARASDVSRFWGPKPSIMKLSKSFFIDKYEVQVKDYQDFLLYLHGLKSLPSRHPLDNVNNQYADFIPELWVDQLKCPSCPVVGIDYFDAWQYAQHVKKRLPTVTEWEMAARGPRGTMFPWGDDYDKLRFNGFASNKALVPVDDSRYERGQTPLGVWQLLGNAAEWVTIRQTDSELKVGASGGSTISRMVLDVVPYGYLTREPKETSSTLGIRLVADENVSHDMVEIAPNSYPIGGLHNLYFDLIRELNDVTSGNVSQALLGDAPQVVDIASFFADQRETSVDEYARFIDELRDQPALHEQLRPPGFPPSLFLTTYEPEKWAQQLRASRQAPVTGVNWYMAASYCHWKGKRLPTIYEFEYMMMGPNTKDLFPSGKAWNPYVLAERRKAGNNAINVREIGPGQLVDVSKSDYQDERGLFHVHGNVSEWVDDPRFRNGDTAYLKGGNAEMSGAVWSFRYYKEAVEKTFQSSTVGFRCVVGS